MKNFFWKFYFDNLAKKYQDFNIKNEIKITTRNIDEQVLNIMIEDIKNKLRLKKEDVLLDIGCATGIIDLKLSENVKFIYGLDIAEELIKKANFNKKKLNIKNVDFKVFSPFNFPQDIKVNKILCYSVIHYFDSFAVFEKLLIALKKILTKNSVILIGDIPEKRKNLKEITKMYYKHINFKNYIRAYLCEKLILRYNLEKVKTLCEKYEFKYEILKQPEQLQYSNDRFDLLIYGGRL